MSDNSSDGAIQTYGVKSEKNKESNGGRDELNIDASTLPTSTSKEPAATVHDSNVKTASPKQSSKSNNATKTVDADTSKKKEDGIDSTAVYDDLTKFWAAWSQRRQHDCLERENNTSEKGCQCFEGLGSVM